MYNVSTLWKSTIKNSHNPISRVDVVRGTQVTTFNVLDGRVVQDLVDPTRWGLDLRIIDEENRSFSDMKDLMSPSLAKLIPYAGIKYPDGTSEWAKCGEMYMKDLDIEEENGSPIWRINSFDGSTRMQSPLVYPTYIPSGLDPAMAVAAFLNPIFAPLTIVPAQTNFVTPPLTIREDSVPWSEARDIITSIGRNLVVNRQGEGVMESQVLEASDLTTPAWIFDEYRLPDFADVGRKFSFEDRPNGVVVIGTHPSVGDVRGFAFDNDPNSDTYFYGVKYGQQVRGFRSEQVTTVDQANAMAQGLLVKLLGPQDEITISVIRNPALDVGDVVLINRGIMGLTYSRMIVSHIDMPLTVTEWMSVTLRRNVWSNKDTLPNEVL